MDAMVSARIPVEIKKRGDRALKEMGSTATELINAAYEYVIEHGRLPLDVAQAPTGKTQLKTLSGSDAQAFRKAWGQRTVLHAREYDGDNFKQQLDKARGDYYARFA